MAISVYLQQVGEHGKTYYSTDGKNPDPYNSTWTEFPKTSETFGFGSSLWEYVAIKCVPDAGFEPVFKNTARSIRLSDIQDESEIDFYPDCVRLRLHNFIYGDGDFCEVSYARILNNNIEVLKPVVLNTVCIRDSSGNLIDITSKLLDL